MNEINREYLTYAQNIANELGLGKVASVCDYRKSTMVTETQAGLVVKVYSSKAAEGINVEPDYKGEIRYILKLHQLGESRFAGIKSSLYKVQRGIVEFLANDSYRPESKDFE